jgi:hypothetical protein
MLDYSIVWCMTKICEYLLDKVRWQMVLIPHRINIYFRCEWAFGLILYLFNVNFVCMQVRFFQKKRYNTCHHLYWEILLYLQIARKNTLQETMSCFTQTLFSSCFDFLLLPNLFFTDSTHSGLSFDISLVRGLYAETCLALCHIAKKNIDCVGHTVQTHISFFGTVWPYLSSFNRALHPQPSPTNINSAPTILIATPAAVSSHQINKSWHPPTMS